MPAMATPFVAPKVPLSKSSITSDIQPNVAQPSISNHQCGSAHPYKCNNWCNVCEVPITKNGHSPSKKYYDHGSLCSTEKVHKLDTSNINYEPVRVNYGSPFRNERAASRSLRTSKITNSPDHQTSKKATGAVSKKLPNVPPTNENNPHEKYLREAERLLRGKLRDLKCTPVGQRQLPEVPKDITLKCQDHKPVSRSVVKALHDIAESNKHSTIESKRIRHISDSENCINHGLIYNAPKRPRDDSPKNKTNIKPHPESPVNATKKEAWNEPSLHFTTKLPDALRKPQSNGSELVLLAPKALSESSCSSEEDEEDQVADKRNSSGSYNHILHTTVHHPRHTTPELLRHLPLVRNEDKKIHPSLRPSLFAHIPPFIKFVSDTFKAERALPVVVQRALKWKLTTITPIIVKKIVQNTGFKFTRRTPDWVGVWGKHMKSVVFRTLKDNQKLNHFPGTFQIGRKDRLWRNLQRYMNKYGKKEFGFMPRTYILPQDMRALRTIWDKQDSIRWIVKPPASARGTGIKVLNKWADIPKKVPLIVQKYISNPYLINGSKFDLRLYVLVTSFDPLRIYIYENGLVRFASARYSDDIKTLNDRFIHLTNYSINKFSNSYSSNDDASACLGHKWTLRSLWTFLSGSVNIDALWSSLVDLVIKTIICGESSISHLSRTNLSSRYCCYELFGIDVLLDENLKPWLLEVNISPSLHSGSTLDTAVKGPLVTNILNLVGYHIPDTLNQSQKTEASAKMGVRGPLTLDHRMYVMQLSAKEKEKQAHYSTVEDRDMYLDEILQDLTPDDVRHLIQYEDEVTQTGNFQKIFPSAHSHPYHKFMEGQCYYNRLLDAWEYRYSKRREEGYQINSNLSIVFVVYTKELEALLSRSAGEGCFPQTVPASIIRCSLCSAIEAIDRELNCVYNKDSNGIALLRSFCDREVHLDVTEIEPRTSISLTDISSSQLVTPGTSDSQSSATDTAKKSDELNGVDVPEPMPARVHHKISLSRLRSLQSYHTRTRRIRCRPSSKPAK